MGPPAVSGAKQSRLVSLADGSAASTYTPNGAPAQGRPHRTHGMVICTAVVQPACSGFPEPVSSIPWTRLIPEPVVDNCSRSVPPRDTGGPNIYDSSNAANRLRASCIDSILMGSWRAKSLWSCSFLASRASTTSPHRSSGTVSGLLSR